ncbi:hypothetical protein [Pontibaca salina]|uniref:Uncharacterized protein n=1 Tax=Pontibaca salina TaxID=2795731 RepID=A0A934HWE2_9RHOB|nr:hypothetical protein [Pontibaca salina]MBI6630759.1 hypothetical protein [Pontibaca salina]
MRERSNDRRSAPLARRSELVALTVDDIEFRADGTQGVLIRRNKADSAGFGRVVFISQRAGGLVSDWL